MRLYVKPREPVPFWERHGNIERNGFNLSWEFDDSRKSWRRAILRIYWDDGDKESHGKKIIYGTGKCTSLLSSKENEREPETRNGTQQCHFRPARIFVLLYPNRTQSSIQLVCLGTCMVVEFPRPHQTNGSLLGNGRKRGTEIRQCERKGRRKRLERKRRGGEPRPMVWHIAIGENHRSETHFSFLEKPHDIYV